MPLRSFEVIPPAAKIKDISKATIALFTTGGLVPVGNPDKIKQAFAVSFGIYDMTGLDALKKGVYESIHGGYEIGDIYKFFGATCGVGTNIGSSQEMGKKWANMLKDAKVDACLLTST